MDGASNLGVRAANAQQFVDASTIENNVFALLGTWLVVITPPWVSHAMCCGASWVMHWRVPAQSMLITWQLWIANAPIGLLMGAYLLTMETHTSP